MTEPTIVCPSCRNEIRLTESLAAPLIEATREQFRRQLAEKDADVGRRELAIQKAQQELARAKDAIDQEVLKRLDQQRGEIARDEAARAKRAVELEVQKKDRDLRETQERLADQTRKLTEAQAAEAELMKKTRALDDEKRELALTVQKGINHGLQQEREKAKREAEEGAALRLREKEEQIAGMQRQIEELRRRAEQGSQQLQGEVQELMLEEELRARFPTDLIEPVAKGEFGGDVVQRVVGPGGRICGSILWESKRTKNWSDSWLVKLREDQRRAKADLALIVTQALPKDIESFSLIEEVWVTGPKCAMPVAIALRESLLLMSSVKAAGEGQQTKMALMYDYLVGPQFKHRISAIAERFSEMQDDLAQEKRATMRTWAKREKQLEAVLTSTSGLYGDLQGIAGKAMLDIEALTMPQLSDTSRDSG